MVIGHSVREYGSARAGNGGGGVATIVLAMNDKGGK